MASKRRLSDEQLQSAAALVKAGGNTREVAASFGLSYSGLCENFTRRGFKNLVRDRRGTKTLVMPTDQTTIAYLAGLFDGEGTTWRAVNKRGSIQWGASIYSTDKPLMDWLASFGGLTYTRKAASSLRHAHPIIKSLRQQYAWTVQRRADVLTFLTAIRPFLRIKADKVDQIVAEIASIKQRDRTA